MDKCLLPDKFTNNLIIVSLVAILVVVVYFSSSAPYLAISIPIVVLSSIFAMILLAVADFKEIWQAFGNIVNRYSLAIVGIIILSFLLFSILFLKKIELIFFDEQIYQSIALNFLKHGTASLCIYATNNLNKCYLSTIQFDPLGYPVILAMAFKLFGSSQLIAYNLELFFSGMTIFLIFLSSSILTGRQEIGVISSLIYALIPEVLIWSKTPANPNIPFAMFFSLSLLFFTIFIKRQNIKSLYLFLFSLIAIIYIRVEAVLLIPLFLAGFILLNKGASNIQVFKNKNAIVAFILFLILILPETVFTFIAKYNLDKNRAFINLLAKSLSPNRMGPVLDTHIGLFSANYFISNILTNIRFLFGFIKVYPIIFLPGITLFAAFGLAFSIIDRKSGSFKLAIFLGIVFLAYFIFYSFYFSGSVLLGGSVRFMLIVYPALSILAGLGVYLMSLLLFKKIGMIRNSRTGKPRFGNYIPFCIICAAIILIAFVWPFAKSIPFLQNPNYNYPDFPLKLNATTENSIYSMAYLNRSLSFIGNNYLAVPSNCLVFSETPYLWYGLNRSSVIPGIISYQNTTIKNYSCYIFDYSSFCSYPNISIECNKFLSQYKTRIIVSENNGNLPRFALYQILNFSG